MEKNIYHRDADDDRAFDIWKAENEQAVRRVDRYLDERMFWNASPEMVSYVTLARYAALIDMARESLRGMFTAEDFRLLFNAHPQPWWPESSWCSGYSSIADALYWQCMSDGLADPAIVDLHSKVQALDTVPLLAFTDLLECGWRQGIASIVDATEAIA